MATEDWIEESLARLESLEEERKKHEEALETASEPATLRMHTQAIERLEAKIKALYAQLEAVAEQTDSGEDAGDSDDEADASAGDDSDEGEPQATEAETRLFRREDLAPAPAAAPVAARPVPAPAPAPVAQPFAQPSASPFSSAPAAAPFSSAPATSPFGSPPSDSPSFPTSTTSFDAGDTESEGSGSGSKMGLIIGAIVVVVGIGAYFAFGGKKDEPPPQVPVAGEAKVIKRGDIPPDTQGPRTPEGTKDSTQGSQIKETNRGGGGGGGGGGSSTPSSTAPKKKDDKKTKIEKTDDPLAGIN